MQRTRREFLAEVGRGMLIASVGPALAADIGLASARAAEGAEALNFGKREPLVCLLQETPVDKLMPLLVARLRDGTELSELVAAAALANARTFGGEDYVGFHTLMALSPAYTIAKEMGPEKGPLPILKVLYRNTNRIQQFGGRKNEVLHPVAAAAVAADKVGGEVLRDAVRAKDLKRAEASFAALAASNADDAYNHLLYMVQDDTEVHRIVLAYRAFDLLNILGKDQAHTLLRQSVHYCVKAENNHGRWLHTEVRTLLPKLLDEHKLMGRTASTRTADDAWLDKMSQTIFKSTAAGAAEVVAAALAEGFPAKALGEAISLAANQLVLRDAGRPKEQTSPGKPVGSIHGDSIGVHASDSANAWRNIARIANHRNCVASLILAAYQVALDRTERGGKFLEWQPWPRLEDTAKIKAKGEADLLRELDDAIRHNDQGRACAAVDQLGKRGSDAEKVFAVLRQFAVSEDGALHAEKYYGTVRDEFTVTRPAFRWRHLLGLARVTASEYGQPAPGYDEACRLLKV